MKYYENFEKKSWKISNKNWIQSNKNMKLLIPLLVVLISLTFVIETEAKLNLSWLNDLFKDGSIKDYIEEQV